VQPSQLSTPWPPEAAATVAAVDVAAAADDAAGAAVASPLATRTKTRSPV